MFYLYRLKTVKITDHISIVGGTTLRLISFGTIEASNAYLRMTGIDITLDPNERINIVYRILLGSQLLVYKIQKHFQNVMLVGMASEISKNYTYKCVDRSRHNGIRVPRLNVHTNQILAHTFSLGTLDSVVS